MAITFVGGHSVASGNNATSVTNNVPAGTTTDDLMLWIIDGNVTTVPATPSGWLSWQGSLTASTNQQIIVFYRWGLSEPASYTATVATGKWNGHIMVWRGVDLTTPKDVANTTATLTTGQANPASITTVTNDAWVMSCKGINSASGDTSTTYTPSGTLRGQVTGTISSAVNIASAVQDQIQATAGTASPTLVASGTPSRSAAVTSALRPAAGAAVALPARPRVALVAVARAAM